MNVSTYELLRVLTFTGIVAWPVAAIAQTSERDTALPPAEVSDPVRPNWSPLGLPRLSADVFPGDAPAAGPDVFTVDALKVSERGGSNGVRERHQRGSRWIEIDPDKEFNRPLMGEPDETLFVSFKLNASDGTIVNVNGAWLGVSESPISNSAQLMTGQPGGSEVHWEPTGLHVHWEIYESKVLASFPVITVRIDPARKVWDVYAGTRQLVDNVPLAINARSTAREFDVVSGVEGAWLVGLVQSSENPLYEDTNKNGIDDVFERDTGGTLLAADAKLSDRQARAAEWRASPPNIPPTAMPLIAPLPDHLVTEQRGITIH